MIIIDKPYISEFLIDSIKKNNFQIISTSEARELISDESLNWIDEKEAKGIIERNPNFPIYTNSENTIHWIENNLGSTNLPNQIHVFKNKIKFRELLKDSFPDFFFKKIKYENLHLLKVEEMKYPFIIKPAIGFFSLGVNKVDRPNEWKEVLDKIKFDIEKLNGLYPKEVIDITDFIIEECLNGEEYAIDCYYNNNGEPVVLNILHHIFSSNKDVNDRVYSTSEDIFKKYKSEIQDFLKEIGLKVKLKNFPAHVEVRIDKNGKVYPIEVNPLRFGGWCTTGDISWYAFGFNSYEYFINAKQPNWEEIFETRKGKKYSIIVLDNNSGIDGNEIDCFDYNQLLKDFTKPLTLRKVDFKEHPLFGFVFVETSIENENELTRILNSRLREYIKEK